MNRRSMSLDEAMELIKEKRKEEVPDPIPAFMSQLKTYELSLKRMNVQVKYMKKKRKNPESAIASEIERTTCGPSMPIPTDHGIIDETKDIEAPKKRIFGPCLPPSTESKL